VIFDDTTGLNLTFQDPTRSKFYIKRFVVYFYPFLLMNYDIFFFISAIIGLGSLNCRYVWIKGGLREEGMDGNFV
jgi:hypothetical protein